MNLLDKNTKAKLDAGNAVMLDSKGVYQVATRILPADPSMQA